MQVRYVMMALLFCGTVSLGQVSYREIFPEGGRTFRDFGWRLYVDGAARDASGARAWGGGPGAGNEPPVASHDGKVERPWQGFVWVSQGQRYVLFTDEVVVQRPMKTLRWHMALRSADDQVFPLVQVDVNQNGRDELDPYFIAADAFTDASDAIDQTKAHQLDVENAMWRPLAFKPGTALPAVDAAGAPQKLPDGPIIAFGFYAASRGANHVYDSVEVESAGLVGREKAAAQAPTDTASPFNHRAEVDVSKVTGAEVDESLIRRTIHLAAAPRPDADGSSDRPYDNVEAAFKAFTESLKEGVPTRLVIGDGVYRQRVPPLNFETIGGKAVETPAIIEGATASGAVF
ncbi:MAG TPA: hypothetical protein PKB10_08390 [Tepidisphaeraceae bacterium]|nr:hypothetical protein [Tepidisphaeraceae bacterium]